MTPVTRTIGRRIATWGFFGVLAALVPLWFAMSERADLDQPSGVADVLATGELILVSAVLVAGSLGELLVRTQGLKLMGIINVVAACAIFMGGFWFYGRVESAHLRETAGGAPSILHPPQHVFGWSVTILLVALFVGASTIWINTLEETR